MRSTCTLLRTSNTAASTISSYADHNYMRNVMSFPLQPRRVTSEDWSTGYGDVYCVVGSQRHMKSIKAP